MADLGDCGFATRSTKSVPAMGVEPPDFAFFAAGGYIKPAAAASSATPYDPLWRQVNVLLRGQGTADSSEMPDEAGGLWRRTGTAQLSSEQPLFGTTSIKFSDGGYLLRLDADAPTNRVATGFADTGTIDVEMWLYQTSRGTETNPLFTKYTGQSEGWYTGLTAAGAPYIGFGSSGSYQSVVSSAVIPLNSWTHVRFLKTGKALLAVFVNGVCTAVRYVANSNPVEAATTPLYFGYDPLATSRRFTGYARDIRITSHSLRYNGTEPFAVPTSTLPYKPAATWASDPFGDSVVCQIDYPGVDAGLAIRDIDEDHALALGGTAIIDRDVAAFTSSGSILLDGSATALAVGNDHSRVRLGNTGSSHIGTGDYTVEAWCWPTSLPSAADTNARYILRKVGSSTSEYVTGYLLGLQWDTTNSRARFFGGHGTNAALVLAYADETATANTLYHVELVKSGTTLYLFVNGVLRGTTTATDRPVDQGGSLYLGHDPGNTARTFIGNIGPVRITRAARHTSGFTPPALPLARPTYATSGASSPALYLDTDGRLKHGATPTGAKRIALSSG